MRAAQRPQEAEEPPDENTALETNRALHAMAAHCLRYKTELDALSNVVLELINQHEELSAQLELGTYEKERVNRALKQQLAAVTASTRTREELAKKTKNAMALVSRDFP
jgi:predicted CopG family antitoxin